MNEQVQDNNTASGGSTKIWIAAIIMTLVVVGGLFYYFRPKKTSNKATSVNSAAETKATDDPKTTAETATKTWQAGQVAIAGNYADAEVVELGDGRYRIYYSAEPETPGFNGQVYSAVSTDGITWSAEPGERKSMSTFPDVIKLPNGRWRMYFQNAGVIKSALSTDGVTFTDEPGTRIDKEETGFNLANVGAQSTTILPDGTYLMAYRGLIEEPYKTTEPVPNNNTQLYFYATSTDGLNFSKKGLALDSRNENLYGLADGGEWVNFDSELRLYFWSYKGIFHTTYENGAFTTSVFDFTNNANSQVKFAPDPPSDPTLLKIDETWRMYYGQHTKGIYFTEYR